MALSSAALLVRLLPAWAARFRRHCRHRRSQFRTYVVQELRSSYRYNSDVVVGADCLRPALPTYEVPAEYGVKNYRYTVVNDRTVLVDPHSRRIVQIIE